MKKLHRVRKKLPIILLLTILWFHGMAQNANWPKVISAKNGALITIYQPQPENLRGDKLSGRAAVSIREDLESDPIFGAFWFEASIRTDRDTREFYLVSIMIKDVKIPGLEDQEVLSRFRLLLETEMPKWELKGSIDDIIAAIEMEQSYIKDDLKNDPPVILYSSEPSLLVLMDGEPRIQQDENLKMKRVINTPFLLVQANEDSQFYLYGGNNWYKASSVSGEWLPASTLTASLQELDKQIKEKEKENNPEATGAAQSVTMGNQKIIISFNPAELIQSNGPANMTNIPGTSLLYVSNSEDDIFMDIDSQTYYILLSGRWYAALKLEGPWSYVDVENLPADFAKIPKGSPKDAVLSSIPGTDEAKEAILDAQVPQTAKVDRSEATCTVSYDGEPEFEPIEGTDLLVAINTSGTVIKSGNRYFCVENGVWFVSGSAKGPWKVSDERPADVDKIPPSSEVYNVKYVYIYESTPEYVYVGYTPGYMGCYVYGPTVVYGTGYYYNPWYGPHYYPRPATYGFSMHYNPWTGWSMGFHYSTGCFSFHMYGGGYGGYWGPPMYRPPYPPPYHGYYGNRPVHYGDRNDNINRDRTNNIYNQRNGINTNDVKRDNSGNRQGGQASAGTMDRGNNNVYADRNGNVYQRDNSGNWEQRDGNQWRSAENAQQMDRQAQMRDNSANRSNTYQQTNRGGNMGANYNRGSAGARPAGGGGGMRRR